MGLTHFLRSNAVSHQNLHQYFRVVFSLKVWALALLLSFGFSLNAGAVNNKLFPKPPELEKDVEFWKRVYTEVTTKQGFIHDDRYLGVVYQKIDLPEGVSRKARQRYVKHIKNKYKNILKTLASGKRTGLSKEQQRVLDLWPAGVENSTLRGAQRRIRFQLGQANKFKEGLIRSGTWKPYILQTLEDMGLPKEISALPHVESSFNPKAYSKVGAAGLWQFTRSTGRRFMRVDHVVDERMDPYKATISAARLLENNYAVTGAWPLAITAYNHGAAGMRRAVAQLGTTDIFTVVRNYRSRSFKFASRNFYLAFLAAIEIDADPEKYFGPIKYLPEQTHHVVKLDHYVSPGALAKSLDISVAELKRTNPALRPAVWSGQKLIPKGYELRLDANFADAQQSVDSMLAQIDSSELHSKQKPDLFHRIRRGQTLSTIAARYGVSTRELMALNNLRSRHRIRAGQLLRLPQRGHQASDRMLASAPKKYPAKADPRAIPESGFYRVRRGDNLARIASRYGMSTQELLAINNLRNRNRIYPGQKLRLIKDESVADRAIAQAPQGDFYKVRRGDTIARIAKRHGMNTRELLSLNNLRTGNRIYPGQRLLLAKADVIADSKQENGATENEAMAGTSVEASQASLATTDNSQAPSKLPIFNPEPVETAVTVAVADEAQGLPEEAADSNQVAETETATEAENTESVSPDTDTATQIAKLQTSEINTLAKQYDLNNASAEEKQEATGPADTEANEDSSDSETVEVTDESLGTSAISESETETDMLADPTDYSVSNNKTIEIHAEETLGHYAEWLQLRASKLRRINRMRYGKPVVVGRRLKLDFSKVSPDEFEEQRMAYHREIQETFFEQFEITGSERHKIRRGESIWVLAKRKYKVPLWLLRQYNPDLRFNKLAPGITITFPQIAVKERTTNADKPEKAAPVDSDKLLVSSKP